jgi:hypothetical protein
MDQIPFWEQFKPAVVVRGFLRNYYSPRASDDQCVCCQSPHGHASYSGCVHDETTDIMVDVGRAIHTQLRSLPEGTIVEIVVRCVGHTERAPFVLLKPHIYGIANPGYPEVP